MENLDSKKTWPIFIIFSVIVLGIVGYYCYKFYQDEKNEQQVLQVSDTISSSTTTAPSISDWKAYTNEKYGFSFQYPKDWMATIHETASNLIDFYPSGNRPEIEAEKTGDIVVAVWDNPDKLSLEKFYDGNSHPNFYKDASKGTEKIKIGEVDAVKFKGVTGLMTYTIIVISKDNFIIEINDNGENHQNDGIFDEIVNSFKFINTGNSSSTEKVEDLVKLFEDYHKIKDNSSILKMFDLFTSPVTESEKSTYDYLLGKDAAAPRLNGTATFDYTIKNYEIQNVAQEKCLSGQKCINGGYVVKVKETRNVSTDNVGENRKDVNNIKYFNISSQNGKYLIDKYYNDGVKGDIPGEDGSSTIAQKYEGFYSKY